MFLFRKTYSAFALPFPPAMGITSFADDVHDLSLPEPDLLGRPGIEVKADPDAAEEVVGLSVHSCAQHRSNVTTEKSGEVYWSQSSSVLATVTSEANSSSKAPHVGRVPIKYLKTWQILAEKICLNKQWNKMFQKFFQSVLLKYLHGQSLITLADWCAGV